MKTKTILLALLGISIIVAMIAGFMFIFKSKDKSSKTSNEATKELAKEETSNTTNSINEANTTKKNQISSKKPEYTTLEDYGFLDYKRPYSDYKYVVEKNLFLDNAQKNFFTIDMSKYEQKKSGSFYDDNNQTIGTEFSMGSSQYLKTSFKTITYEANISRYVLEKNALQVVAKFVSGSVNEFDYSRTTNVKYSILDKGDYAIGGVSYITHDLDKEDETPYKCLGIYKVQTIADDIYFYQKLSHNELLGKSQNANNDSDYNWMDVFSELTESNDIDVNALFTEMPVSYN